MEFTSVLQPPVTIKVEEEEVSDVKGCYIWLSESTQPNLLEENAFEEQRVIRPKRRNCAVYTCPNYFYKRADQPLLSFHSFPKDERIREIWIKLCNRPVKFSANSAYICSDHFKPQDYLQKVMVEYKAGKRNNRLIPGAIPSRNLPVLEIEPNSSSCSYFEENIFVEEEELIISSDDEAESSSAHDRLNGLGDNEVSVSKAQDLPAVITVSSDEESSDSVRLKKDVAKHQQLVKEKKLRLLKQKYRDLENSLEELKVKTNEEIEKLDNILQGKEEEYNRELREVLSVFLKPDEIEAIVRQARW